MLSASGSLSSVDGQVRLDPGSSGALLLRRYRDPRRAPENGGDFRCEHYPIAIVACKLERSRAAASAAELTHPRRRRPGCACDGPAIPERAARPGPSYELRLSMSLRASGACGFGGP